MKKRISWNGVDYKDVSTCANALGVHPHTVRRRLKKGWQCDADIRRGGNDGNGRAGRARQSIIWNGIEYPSLAACARALGISERAVAHRRDNGYSCDADMKLRRPVKWNGIKYAGVSKAAKALGITVSGMSARIRRGEKKDSDINKHNRPKPVKWNGISYPSHRAAARALGIKIPSFLLRLRRGYRCDADMQRPKKIASSV